MEKTTIFLLKITNFNFMAFQNILYVFAAIDVAAGLSISGRYWTVAEWNYSVSWIKRLLNIVGTLVEMSTEGLQ